MDTITVWISASTALNIGLIGLCITLGYYAYRLSKQKEWYYNRLTQYREKLQILRNALRIQGEYDVKSAKQRKPTNTKITKRTVHNIH